MNEQTIQLDVSKEPAITPVVYLGQGDKNGTTLKAELYDNGVPLNVSGYSVRFEMRLPDHSSFYRVNGTLSGNVATITIDETYAASITGQTCIAYVVIYSGSTTICSTNRINVIVLESADYDADPAHAYESGIIAATEAANAAAASANSAASSANSAAGNATTAAGNASTQATAAQTAAASANTAASNANQQAAAAQRNADAASTAATAANAAAVDTNDATTRANAAIDAMGDISELAVPLMTKDTRGGAKLGNSLQLVDERLNVKLTASGSGRSVATESAEALQSLTVHGESIQDGTPTPDNPVPVQVVQSVQLLSFTPGTTTRNGLTSTISEDGTWTISGTATADTIIYYTPQTAIPIVTGDKVTLSGMPTEGYGSSAWRVALSGSGYFSSPNGTLTSVSSGLRGCHVQVKNGFTMPTGWRATPMMVRGDTAYPYVPYGSIGLKVGDTVTPIDLQGNVLASLSDGTRDRLLVDSAGHKVIDNTVGHIASYNGETVGNVWLSNTGQLTTGADVYYKLATHQLIDLGYIDMPAIESGDAISVSASIVPVIDASWWERGAGAVADVVKAIMAAVNAKTSELAEAIADITNG